MPRKRKPRSSQTSSVPIEESTHFTAATSIAPQHIVDSANADTDTTTIKTEGDTLRSISHQVSFIPILEQSNVGGKSKSISEISAHNAYNSGSKDLINHIGLPQWEQVQTLKPPDQVSQTISRTHQHNTNYRQHKARCTTLVSHEASNVLALGDDLGIITMYSILPLVRPMMRYDTHASSSNNDSIPIDQLCFGINGEIIICGSSIGLEILDVRTGSSVAFWKGFNTFRVEKFISFKNDSKIIDVSERSLMRKAPTRLDVFPGNTSSAGTTGRKSDNSFLASFAFDYTSVASKTEIKGSTQEIDMLRVTCYSSPLVFLQPHVPIADNLSDGWIWNCHVEPVIPKEYRDKKWKDVYVGSKAVGMWDKSNNDNIIAVFLVRDDQNDMQDHENDSSGGKNKTTNFRQELFLFDYHTRRIHARTLLPHKMSGAKILGCEVVNQSPRGKYTLVGTTTLTNHVSTSSGIRLYQTDNLLHLMSFGGISLHGNQLMWQDCFFTSLGTRYPASMCGNQTASSVENNYKYQEKWGRILEISDEILNRRCHQRQFEKWSQEEATKEESIGDLYIVSIPHAFREPVELKDKIHFWNLVSMPVIPKSRSFTDGDVVVIKSPSFTMKGPTKSRGIHSLLYTNSLMTLYGGRFFVTTQNGEFHKLTPKLMSDFAGQMYPPGYISIDDNVMYIEDEDELDQTVYCSNYFTSSAHMESPNKVDLRTETKRIDADLEMALKMSIASEENNDDEIFDVIGNDSPVTTKSKPSFIPCRPENQLRRKMEENEKAPSTKQSDVHGNVGGITEALLNGSTLLNLFPQKKIVDDFIDGSEEREIKRKREMRETMQKISDARKTKTRKRSGSTQSTSNQFVDEALYVAISEREIPADGSGSIIASSVPKQNSQCLACLGRMSIHTCGSFTAPKDIEAIIQAEKEKTEKEMLLKKQLLAEKRKVAAQKRQEKKQKEQAALNKCEHEQVANPPISKEQVTLNKCEHEQVVNPPISKEQVTLNNCEHEQVVNPPISKEQVTLNKCEHEQVVNPPLPNQQNKFDLSISLSSNTDEGN